MARPPFAVVMIFLCIPLYCTAFAPHTKQVTDRPRHLHAIVMLSLRIPLHCTALPPHFTGMSMLFSCILLHFTAFSRACRCLFHCLALTQRLRPGEGRSVSQHWFPDAWEKVPLRDWAEAAARMANAGPVVLPHRPLALVADSIGT